MDLKEFTAANFSRGLREREKLMRRGIQYILVIGLLVALMSACGKSTTGHQDEVPTAESSTTPLVEPTITPPNDLITPGMLTVGSGPFNPPEIYLDTANKKISGFDIDLISLIAQHLGLKMRIVPTDLGAIFDDLAKKRFDVGIIAISVTPERQKKVDFVPYIKSGESLLVQKGNPVKIKSISDLCGQNVGVQPGTIEWFDLQSASGTCTNAGKPPINLTFAPQEDIVNLLARNLVVATYQDSPVTDYFIKLHPGRFEIGGSAVNEGPEGIAVRKGNTSMLNAIQSAFDQLKADGAYRALIQKWGLTNEAIN